MLGDLSNRNNESQHLEKCNLPLPTLTSLLLGCYFIDGCSPPKLFNYLRQIDIKCCQSYISFAPEKRDTRNNNTKPLQD